MYVYCNFLPWNLHVGIWSHFIWSMVWSKNLWFDEWVKKVLCLNSKEHPYVKFIGWWCFIDETYALLNRTFILIISFCVQHCAVNHVIESQIKFQLFVCGYHHCIVPPTTKGEVPRNNLIRMCPKPSKKHGCLAPLSAWWKPRKKVFLSKNTLKIPTFWPNFSK